MIKTLYKKFLKPILFLLDAEFVHNQFTNMGQLIGSNATTKNILKLFLNKNNSKLVMQIDGISFPNRVGLAAGFDYNGRLVNVLSAVGFGFQTVGTVTYQPYKGNPTPRLGRFPRSQSLLVNKGLKTLGAKQIIKDLERIGEFDIPTGISIASTNTHFNSLNEQLFDFLATFYLFEKSQVKHSHYELNISCPNTFGGEPFTTPDRLEILLSALDKFNISKPIYVKMPIDFSDRDFLALLKVINRHSIAGVNIGNLTKDKKNPDVNKQDRVEWKQKKGNLSGKPTFKRSNHLIQLTKSHYKNRFTIIGTGGIFTPQDAKEKIKNGADLVQLITGMIYEGPQVVGQIASSV